MICHVCSEQAVGQCKTCSKFYCAAHGDIYCVTCKEAQKAARRGVSPQGEGGMAGPTCFRCTEPAAGACGKCGQFFCTTHRGKPVMATELWGTRGRTFCAECIQGVNAYNLLGCVAAAVAIVIGGIVLMIGLS